MNPRSLRRVQRARVAESRVTPSRGENKHPECKPTSTPNVSGQAGTTIGPLDHEPWVTVVPGERLFEVRCSACRGWHIAYAVTVTSQPGLLQRLCDEHANCLAPVAA